MITGCAHCGQTCGDYDGGFGTVNFGDGRGMIQVCHPNAAGRPDCFRRVLVYGEPVGWLLGVEPLPPGITGCAAAENDAFLEMVALTEELRLYEEP